LLLEPQRTNLFLWSEQLANWGGASAGTLLSNAAISPDGYQNADVIQATDTDPYRYQNITFTGTVTFSLYVKGIGTSIGKQGDIRFGANVQAFTLTGSWQRVSVTAAIAGTASYGIETINPAVIGEQVAVWGGQVEAGAYATSYIPTLSTSVTRVADAASKTGISSLIGQTEGTIFVEGEAVTIDTNASSPIYITVSDNNTTDICYFQQRSNGTIRVDYFTGAVLQARIASTTTYPLGTKIKAALGYKSGDFVFYINGVQIGTDVGTSIAPLSKVTIGGYETAGFTGSAISQALLFKTRLTNDQLAELTA
jgi:hypothetical protein